MPPDYPEPSVRDVPDLETVAPYYDHLLELARELLDGPISTRIKTWEDGEFEIRAFHGYGPHPQRPRTTFHHVLRYHSGDDEIVAALLAVDIDTVDKTLIARETVQADGVRLDAGRPQRKNGSPAGGD